jgi:ribosomal-protein-alanine N-acetyltransferase
VGVETAGGRAVTLRDWGPDDAGFIAALLSDDDVRRLVGGSLEPSEAARRAASLASDVPWGWFLVLKDLAPVGTVTFDRKRGPWEVSFQLVRAAWGRGVMTDALAQAVRWFRSEQPDEPLIAVTQTVNAAARRTLERCGGVVEAEFEQYGAPQVQYRLL